MTILEDLSDGSEALQLAVRVRREFDGKAPRIQLAALAELMAAWMSAQEESVRPDVFRAWVDAVRKLTIVADYERQARAKPSN